MAGHASFILPVMKLFQWRIGRRSE
jgi:hypothetical protein